MTTLKSISTRILVAIRNRSFAVMVVLLVAPLLNGCVGLVADSMAKSMVTGKTYREMSSNLPKIKEGTGRLYVYRTKSSTKTSLVIGIGLLKNPTLFTIDDTAYELVWEAFRFVDVPAGQHELTCGSDVLKSVEFWSSKQHYQKGTSRITVSVPLSGEVFVRLDPTSDAPHFHAVLVDGADAKTELVELSYQKPGNKVHSFSGGKLD